MAKMDPDEVRRRLEQEAADEELARRLDSDPEFAENFDDSFERNLEKFDNEFLLKFAKDKGYSESEAEAMIRAAERAKKAMSGGWFGSKDPVKAEKIIMSNRGMRELKTSKKDKGCAVVLLFLVVASSSTAIALIIGAVEVIQAIAR